MTLVMEMDNKKEFPKRKSTRLKNYDYSKTGAYFITICTKDRKKLLSSIVGEGSPLPKLSICGDVINNWIQKIPEKYLNVSVDSYVIMPNHIHLILSISGNDGRGNPSPTVVDVIGWLKYQTIKEINEMRISKESIWQRSFHDHVIRDRNDYDKIAKYIYENPIKWKYDCFYTE